MNTNRNYKSSLFSDLFSNPVILRELYPAISGETIKPDEKIEVNTLDNVLYMEQINDLSFTVGDRLVIVIEHQSSLNPNMPLRLLLYIARLYEKMIDRSKLYSTHAIPLPTPEFFVLYNGVEDYPDTGTLSLSEFFTEKLEKYALELTVTVFNINEGHNEGLLGKCKALKGYSVFIEKAREMEAKTHDRAAAIKQALRWCIDNGILVQYLKQKGSEGSEALCASEHART
jgi:hypothetical protein